MKKLINIKFSFILLVIPLFAFTSLTLKKTDLQNIYKVNKEDGEITTGKILNEISENFIEHYDKSGFLIEKIIPKSNGTMNWRYTYKYNNKHQLVTKFLFNFDGSLSNKFVYTYDNEENMITEDSYKTDGSLIQSCDYKYDKSKNIIEERCNKNEENIKIYDSADKYENYCPGTNYDYKYKDNKVIEKRILNTDGTLRKKYVYKYDIKGNKIGFDYVLYVNGMKWKVETIYDNKGNEIEGNIYNENGDIESITQYKYELDKWGNWTQRITFSNNVPQSITTRKISYYK